eukprot:CAMPEP_0116550720 /NCGR_PEP_ID=MMETSP0397-20121206/5577_1 /TAXON_ID=216820 /ORGANISM="Cyclophora tenuis, Strain ECT3854" /LENGTH=354 /DNA_ID=CAMNT_0004075569 /DNA_START=74 /DNA_END=1138 /DNA_ORIENTATION=+
MTGASAGAIAATIMVAGIDPTVFVQKCLDVCEELKVWTRRFGLIGILGTVLERVLQTLVPHNITDRIIQPLPPPQQQQQQSSSSPKQQQHRQSNLGIILTPLGSTRVVRVQDFPTRQCLIDAVLASAHIPYLVNQRLVARFRGKAYIDGSFFAKAPHDYLLPSPPQSQAKQQQQQQQQRMDTTTTMMTPLDVLTLDHTKDPYMQDKTLLDCIRLMSKEEIWAMFKSGQKYAKSVMRRGQWSCLTPKTKNSLSSSSSSSSSSSHSPLQLDEDDDSSWTPQLRSERSSFSRIRPFTKRLKRVKQKKRVETKNRDKKRKNTTNNNNNNTSSKKKAKNKQPKWARIPRRSHAVRRSVL